MGETDITSVIQHHHQVHSATCTQRTSLQCYRRQTAFAEFLQRRGLPSNMVAITSCHVAEFLVHLYNLGFSASTINGYRHALDMLFSFFGYEQGFQTLQHNPVRGVPRARGFHRLEAEFLTCEEVSRLFAVTSAEQPRAILSTLLCTGMWGSELASLRTTNVDFASETIWFTRLRGRPFGKMKPMRKVPMVPSLSAVLAEFITRHRQLLVMNECPWLFVLPGDKPFTADAVYRVVRTSLERAGIFKRSRGVSLLRHTFVARLIVAGVPLSEIACILGYSLRPFEVRWLDLVSSRPMPVHVLRMIDDPFAECFAPLPREVD